MEHLQPNAHSKEGRFLSELLEEDGKCRLENAPVTLSGALLCIVHPGQIVPKRNKGITLAQECFFFTQNLARWLGSWHMVIWG